MGARSRKRRREGKVAGARAKAPTPGGAPPERPRRLRGAERDAQVRATLEPLRPGERPRAVTLAAVVSALLAVGNVVLYFSGYDLQGSDEPSAAGAITFALILLVAAWGMWTGRYWAVLGFQALLAVTAVSATLALLVASNTRAVVLCVVIVLASGTLFWFLIRAMARLQMPDRPGTRGG